MRRRHHPLRRRAPGTLVEDHRLPHPGWKSWYRFQSRQISIRAKSMVFAGFRVSNSAIKPLHKYLDAIRNFPAPESTTDIRSWFGLVNQVANYAQLRDIMAPFKPFLSPKHKFEWTHGLQRSFCESKDAIVEAIRSGIEIFDPTRRTCLRPDWSRQGIGYFLSQKHCNCDSHLPDCCPNGWRITLAGSRFLSPTEQRYAPVEGEALAVAWGLEQSKYFTQGCNDLLVVTDHKPLVKILGDRTLDEISNSRLFRMKQRTMPWSFSIQHLPGKSNCAADATSRHPSATNETSDNLHDHLSIDDVETAMSAAIRHDTREFTALSWERIAAETASDPTFSRLLEGIDNGFTDVSRTTVPGIAPFWTYRESLYAIDGVILYEDRVVIPPSLRDEVLSTLHSAHQGVSSMESRARAIVFWPGMTDDIRLKREHCSSCNRSAPSQAATPPVPALVPSTPFECIFADYFDYGGCHYLVAGDRLSGWVEIFASPPSTAHSGASGLIASLRFLFATFGVPEELSSDGGPEFTASATATFLTRWGVRHRMSSAYFPQSNGRAEVAVKKAKRILMANVGPTGTLDNDGLLRAMLQVRNTPDHDCNVSPAQVVFGRPIRDAFSFVNRHAKFTNPSVRPMWRDAWRRKEEAMRTRFTRSTEVLNEHSRSLPALQIGDRVFLQNQHGPHPNKWDRSGTVVVLGNNDQYHVKVDGSGRLTVRNRRFLRKFTPASLTLDFPHSRDNRHHVHPLPVESATVMEPAACTSELIIDARPSFTGQHHSSARGSTSGQFSVDPTPVNVSHPTIDDAPVPAAAEEDPPVLAAPQTVPRPRRTPQPKLQYVPETGKWQSL